MPVLSPHRPTAPAETVHPGATRLLRLWGSGLLLLWALWWGGLTFYAAVVVPQGTSLFGATEQGALTRQVTLWHNRLTALWLLGLLAEIARQRRLRLLIPAVALALLWLGLLWQHHRLATLLDGSPTSLRDGGFYRQHARYLWLTTGEWLVGLVAPWWLFHTDAPASALTGPAGQE